jgi:hypothetical protein
VYAMWKQPACGASASAAWQTCTQILQGTANTQQTCFTVHLASASLRRNGTLQNLVTSLMGASEQA